MGNFYNNVTLRGPGQSQVLEAVQSEGGAAYVSDTVSGLTIVCPDRTFKSGFAQSLSKRLGCAALEIMNHDDDILAYALFHDGALVDEYNSAPGYFEKDEPGPPSGGSAEALTSLLGLPGDAAKVARILGRSGEKDYLFALERHTDLVAGLNWPGELEYATGYLYIAQGEAEKPWQQL